MEPHSTVGIPPPGPPRKSSSLSWRRSAGDPEGIPWRIVYFMLKPSAVLRTAESFFAALKIAV